MSTELDIEQAAREWMREYFGMPKRDSEARIVGMVSRPEDFAAFHKHMRSLASLPQQDVGAGRSVPSEYVMSRDYEALYDHLLKGGWARLGNATFHHMRLPCRIQPGVLPGINIVVKDSTLQCRTKEGFIAECTRLSLEWLAVPSPVGQEPVAWTKEDLSAIITQSDRIASIEDGGALKVMAEKFTIPLFTHPPKAGVLTDEELQAFILTPNAEGQWTGLAVQAVMKCLRYARDNGYLSPKP